VLENRLLSDGGRTTLLFVRGVGDGSLLPKAGKNILKLAVSYRFFAMILALQKSSYNLRY